MFFFNWLLKIFLKILLKIFFLFKLYVFVLLLSIFFFFFICFFYKNFKFNFNNDFSNKINEGAVFTPLDVLKSAPFIMNWSWNKLTKPKEAFFYVFLLIMCAFTKFILLIISFLVAPLVLSWISVKLIKKEEITLKIKTKWAPDLKYILKLIFIYQPVAIVFKATYSFLKLIKNKQKNIFYSKTLYNLILATVMGFPLWFIDLVNRLENNIQDLNDTKLMRKKKKIQIRFHLFLVAINITIVNNETSYVNTVKRLRIYFDKNKIFFNPNDKKPIKFKKIIQAFGTNPIENKIKNFYEVRAVASLKTQNEVKIHPSYKTKEYGNLTLDGIKTHKPLYGQRSIIENDKERLVYNSIQSNFQIKKAFKSYNPSEEDIRLKTIHIILRRLVDEEAGLHYQNESNLNAKVVVGGYFNDNFIKYINVGDDVLNCIQKENLEFNETIISDSQKENLNYSLNNLEVKKWISNKEFNVLLNDDASLADMITYVEKTTAVANIFQEYTLTDEIQNEYLYQITENLNLKSNEMQKMILEVKKDDNVII